MSWRVQVLVENLNLSFFKGKTADVLVGCLIHAAPVFAVLMGFFSGLEQMWGIKIRKKQSFQKCLIYIIIHFFVLSTITASGEAHRYLDEADEALLSGDYDKAVANYLKGINYVDKTYISKVWDDLGYAYLRKGEYEKAITYLKNSISVHPENLNAWLYMATSYTSN